jgi:hypothetical protein
MGVRRILGGLVVVALSVVASASGAAAQARETGALRVRSTSYFGQRHDYHLSTPRDRLYATTAPDQIGFDIGANGYRFYVSVAHNYSLCDLLAPYVITLSHVTFDQSGRLRTLDASAAMYCDGNYGSFALRYSAP